MYHDYTLNTVDLLIFANFARRTNSRIQESRENYYYNSATKEIEKFANFNLLESIKIRNSRKFKHAKNYQIYSTRHPKTNWIELTSPTHPQSIFFFSETNNNQRLFLTLQHPLCSIKVAEDRPASLLVVVGIGLQITGVVAIFCNSRGLNLLMHYVEPEHRVLMLLHGLLVVWISVILDLCMSAFTRKTRNWRVIARQTRNVRPMLISCWATVGDGGPTWNQHWVNVSHLLGGF